MYYPDEVIDDIVSGNDIVDVIGSYVQLKKQSSDYICLCPFHREKSPSFHVNQTKQLFHCFGCNAGGNVIGFVMQYENLSFPDAVKFLADRIGYNLPENRYSKISAERQQLKRDLYDIHKVAARFYYEQLQTENAHNAVEYLNLRQLSPRTRKIFGLGYAPIHKDALYKKLVEAGFSENAILKSGLVYKNENGSYYEKFYNRLMFPIIDVYGNIIGFGGRVLGDGIPKYLNSPETEIFSKSKNLYNLNLAKKGNTRELILVEGYMDAITIYQAGFTNVVASLGTAFNENHARVLKSYADSAILLFDSDEAGVKAVLRAIPVLKNAGLKVKVLQVTDAKDPDEYIKKFGSSAFGELLKTSKSHILFEAEQIQKKYDLTLLEDKIAFTNEIATLLSNVENSIEKDAYLKEVSRITQIDISTIRDQINSINGTSENNIEYSNINKRISDNGVDLARRGIINLVVSNKAIYEAIKDKLLPKELVNPIYIKVLEIIYNLYKENKPVLPNSIVSNFETVEEQNNVSKIFVLETNFSIEENEKALNDQIKKVKEAYYNKLISESMDSPDILEIIKEKRNISKLHISLSNG